MSTVIAHGMAGALCMLAATEKVPTEQLSPKQSRRLLWVTAALAILPDLDVLVFILFRPENMQAHRGFSHSILFALIVVGLSILPLQKLFAAPPKSLLFGLSAACLSHPILDYLMGCGPPIPFFAPFSWEGFLFPVRLVPTAFYGTSFSALAGLVTHLPTIIGLGLEVLIFIPLLMFYRRRQSSRYLFIGIPLIALVVTFVLYN